MKKLLTTLLFSTLLTDSFAQIQWQKCLGGSDNEYANSLQQTFDGGYIIAGYSRSNDGDLTSNLGYEDNWVVKLSPTGSIEWQKSFGGSSDDLGGFVCQTADTGYIMAGISFSNDGDVSGNHGQKDYWVVKLSSSGNIQWQKCFGGSLSDGAQSIQQTADGGYIVAGYTSSTDGDISGNHGGEDYWVVKLSASGNIEWQNCYGGSSNDEAESIRQTSDGGYIVVGNTNSNNGDVTGFHGGLFDCWVIKLSASGSIDWQKCYGGTNDDEVFSVEQTSDGGYIIAGYSKSSDGDVTGNHGSSDCWMIKLSASGLLQWQRSLGGGDMEGASAVQQTSDGGYIVSGSTYSNNGDVTGNHGNNDYWIVKLSALGDIQWQKCLGSSGQDGARCVRQTLDGGYVLTGYTNGNNGDVSGNHGGQDFWVVKLDAKTFVDGVNKEVISIMPNPASGIINIKGVEKPIIRIYNVSGQLIKEAQNVNAISISDCAPGMYFIQLLNDKGYPIYQDKIIKN